MVLEVWRCCHGIFEPTLRVELHLGGCTRARGLWTMFVCLRISTTRTETSHIAIDQKLAWFLCSARRTSKKNSLLILLTGRAFSKRSTKSYFRHNWRSKQAFIATLLCDSFMLAFLITEKQNSANGRIVHLLTGTVAGTPRSLGVPTVERFAIL